MKSDKSLLQKNHDELSTSISAKDKELKDANEHASSTVIVKVVLEEELRQTQKKLFDAETGVCSKRLLIEGFQCENCEMKTELDGLRELKVKYSKVVLIEEQGEKLEKQERRITEMEVQLESSQKELDNLMWLKEGRITKGVSKGGSSKK